MKFSVSTGELQKVLSVTGGVIPPKSTLPILENFLFDLSKDQLKISATDLDTALSMTLKAKGSKDGRIAIPAKRLTDTVRALPNTEVTFMVDTESKKIVMATANGEYKLTGESSDNYPSTPTFKGTDELNIEDQTLQRLIGKSSFAVSSDELRPAMMGILFQIKKNEIRAVATDGHRLVRFINSGVSVGKVERDIIIPAKALNLAMKYLSSSSSTVVFGENHAMFSSDGTTLVSRIIQEKYPNYESVIPLDNDRRLVIDKEQLISSVKRTSLYASSTTHQVRFSLKKNSLVVSAEDIDFGSEAKETIACEYTAEPLEIGFNSGYVVDILSHIDTSEVEMMFSTPTRASIVKPVNQRDGENLLMLVMPVRLSS